MDLRWRTLALGLLGVAALAAGCSSSHEGGGSHPPGSDVGPPPWDAGSPSPDAGGTCGVEAGFVTDLACPGFVPAGEVATIEVTHTTGICCSPEAASLRVSETGAGFVVESIWDDCSCCRECRCATAPTTQGLALGPLEPGEVTVQAGDLRCTITVGEAPPPPPDCSFGVVSEVRMPRVIWEGDPLTVTLIDREGFGCGCGPMASATSPTELDLALCGCCEVCDCIDGGYEVTYTGANPTGALDHRVRVGENVLSLAERAPADCRPMPPTGLRVVPPTDFAGAEGTYWAVVEGEEFLCCGEHLPLATDAGTDARALALLTCSVDPCDCDCGPEGCVPDPVEAWYPLGPLSPGAHTFRAGVHEVSVTVP